MNEISQKFEREKNFPGIIGFIDGCHIPIKQPSYQRRYYYNRKDFYSVVLQGRNKQIRSCIIFFQIQNIF